MKRAEKVGFALTSLLALVLLGSLVAGLSTGDRSVDTPDVAAISEPQVRIRVEVLNAAGTAGLAHTATEALRDKGFDVVYFGNAGSFGQDSSVVLDRVGKPEAAARVAHAIGIEHVESRPDSTLYLDATVVIGLDWQAANTSAEPFASAESAE